MAITLNFDDRFSFPSSNGISTATDALSAQELSDEEIEEESPELKDIAKIVRSYSVLLSKKRTLEIFNLITQQTDPRIALILASARNKTDNVLIFKGLDEVKEVMYADPNRVLTGLINRNLFSDGIRRVTCALAASILIGQLSQLSEQAEHSKIIEKQALEDLDRVILSYQLSQAVAVSTKTKTSQDDEDYASAALFFEQAGLIQIPSDRQVILQWYSPTLTSGWSNVAAYTGSFNSWQVVVDLADAINSSSLADGFDTLIAVPEQSGPSYTLPTSSTPVAYHALLFYPRRPSPGISSFSINVRFEVQLLSDLIDPPVDSTLIPALAPFNWGPYYDSIKQYPVNGAIVILKNNKATNSKILTEKYEPTVFYFRKKLGTTSASLNQSFTYRVQPWQPLLPTSEDPVSQEVTLDFPYELGSTPEEQTILDSNRYSQIAVALVKSLAEIRLDAKAIGAIIRNDPPDNVDAQSAVEVIAWVPNQAITHVVLDVLKVPPDIEFAVGNISGPKTAFSSNPKSIRVPSLFISSLSTSSANSNTQLLNSDGNIVMPRRALTKWAEILEEAQEIEERVRWY